MCAKFRYTLNLKIHIDQFKSILHIESLMSEQEKPNEWDSLWQEYTKSLENWKALFEQIQTASNDMQAKFNEVWEKAVKESSTDTMKMFGDAWQKSLSEAGVRSFKDFGDLWQKALNESNAAAFKQFAENWQSTMTSSGLEQMAAYGESMKRFADIWGMMWPKS